MLTENNTLLLIFFNAGKPMMPILPILCVCEKLEHKNADVANFVAVPLETKY